MKKIKPTAQTKRTIETIDYLRERRKFKTNVELATLCSFSKSSLATILNQKRQAPDSLKVGLHNAFGVNLSYIEKGQSPMILNSKTTEKNKLPKDPLSIIAVNDRFDFIIKDISKKKNITTKTVFKTIGLTYSYMSQLKKSNEYLIPSKYIKSIATEYSVSPSWLILNQGLPYFQ